ncbi:unnamed protein product, partial [Staurois parvus]
MRPCTASSCCCQVQSVSWAPVPTPNAAARPVICHGPLYRLPMLLPRPDCVMVPVRPPIAAARPVICHGPPYRLLMLLPGVICHGPLYRLLMLLPGPECVMGPCTASHCCCLYRHTLPCATFRSPHTAGGFHFCHRVL